jgi:hypothetical protein
MDSFQTDDNAFDDWPEEWMDTFDSPPPGKFPIDFDTVRRVERWQYGAPWRWAVAERLVLRGKVRPNTTYDGYIWQAVNFLRHVRVELRGELFGDRKVQLAEASKLHSQASTRWPIEARLLAGEPMDEVAAKAGIGLQVLEDYVALFFDTLDRLTARRWIMDRVIHTPEANAPPQQVSLYRAAYIGGRHVCEHWLDHMRDLGEPTDLSTERGREVERLRLLIISEHLEDEDYKDLVNVTIRLKKLPNPPMCNHRSLAGLVAKHVGSVLREHAEDLKSLIDTPCDVEAVERGVTDPDQSRTA